jgi:hypothetical protein
MVETEVSAELVEMAVELWRYLRTLSSTTDKLERMARMVLLAMAVMQVWQPLGMVVVAEVVVELVVVAADLVVLYGSREIVSLWEIVVAMAPSQMEV